MSLALSAVLPQEVASASLEHAVDAELFDEEAASISKAVPKRRQEFMAGRACARMALAQLGFPPVPIPVGRGGEPIWPRGVVGSITHCRGFIASAAGRKTTFAALGIDAEPNEPLPTGTLPEIAAPAEIRHASEAYEKRQTVSWDRFLFSAKESAFKAWFTLTGRPLEPEDITILTRSPDRFIARVPAGTHEHEGITQFHGRMAVHQGVLVTAVIISHEEISQPFVRSGRA